MTNEIEALAGILADEERGAAAKAIADRIATIENLPHGPTRARLCASAHLAAGVELVRILEGEDAAARQLRRLADMIDAQNQGAH